MPDVLTVRVLAEPVLKYNTAVLRCQVPQSAAPYTTIVSWTRGDAHLYPSPRGGKTSFSYIDIRFVKELFRIVIEVEYSIISI